MLETPGGEQVLTLIDAVLTYDEATVERNADDAASGASRLRLLGAVLPIAALVLGLILAAPAWSSSALEAAGSPEASRPAGAV